MIVLLVARNTMPPSLRLQCNETGDRVDSNITNKSFCYGIFLLILENIFNKHKYKTMCDERVFIA